MTRITTLRELHPTISFAIDANVPILLISRTGIGKTEMVLDIGRSKGMSVIVLNLSVMEATDFGGMPITKNELTKYTKPGYLPQADDDRPCILYIDEINRAAIELLNPLLQLITLRQIHGYQLPENCRIVAAMNPDADGYQVTELDPALQQRFLQVEIVPDPAGWVDWAERQATLNPAQKHHPAVLNFVASTPDIFASVFSNPRAWTTVSKLLCAAEAQGCDHKFIRKLVEAKVGCDLARAFMKFYAVGPKAIPPKPEQILKGAPRVREQVRTIAQSGDSAAVEGMVQQMLMYLQDPDRCADVRGSSKTVNALRKFRDVLPAEFRERLGKRLPWIDSRGAKK